MKINFEPSSNLLNVKTGTEQVTSFGTKDDFYVQQKPISDLINEYNNLPGKYFVNESYFLYDKSNLIKNTHITALNKPVSLYGSFSYFKVKNEKDNLILLGVGNILKFLVEKNTRKNALQFQLTNISGNIPKLKDKKIHNFSITRFGGKIKLSMQEPIETIIFRARQNFDVEGGLNPIQFELENDGILNALKKYINVMYRTTPIGLLFPASIKNDTQQIFVTCRQLNGVKKAILNGRIYELMAIIDLNKINSWEEIKGKSIWINTAFKDQKEINNNSHVCFLFVT